MTGIVRYGIYNGFNKKMALVFLKYVFRGIIGS